MGKAYAGPAKLRTGTFHASELVPIDLATVPLDRALVIERQCVLFLEMTGLEEGFRRGVMRNLETVRKRIAELCEKE
jgi:hypothetical protein